MSSENLDRTLKGVDKALIKTSESITEKLTEFKDSYTDTLKGFLDSQADELHKVFGEHTEKLKEVVIGFEDNLGADVESRKELNDELDKLVTRTNGFVFGTDAMITAAFDNQQIQLSKFMENNKSMQTALTRIVDDATDVNHNGNTLTKELIDTTGKLQTQFNDNQRKVLEEFQKETDKQLEVIMGGLGAMIQALHVNNDK